MNAVVLQLFLLAFCSLFLDGGRIFTACCYSSPAFWISTAIILIRRPANPTAGDVTYIRWGLLIIVLVGIPAFLEAWHLKGR
jgi:hypothetical protein